MRARNLVWRSAGVALFGVAVAIGLADRVGSGVKLVGFALALFGLVLIVQGARVAAAWRIERSRHRALAQSIGELRRRSRRAGR